MLAGTLIMTIGMGASAAAPTAAQGPAAMWMRRSAATEARTSVRAPGSTPAAPRTAATSDSRTSGLMVRATDAAAPDGRAAQTDGRAAQVFFEAVLRKYSGYRDFQARFIETPISRATGEGSPESGIVSYRRPEFWRWEYLTPERKIVVIRGKLAAIAVEGEEVSRYDLGDAEQQSGVGLLLSGSERIGGLFSARFEPGGSKDEPVLRLDPLKISDEYDHVLLRVRRRELTILEVVIADPGGNRLRFQLSDLRTNRGLAETLFDLPSSRLERGSSPPAGHEP